MSKKNKHEQSHKGLSIVEIQEILKDGRANKVRTPLMAALTIDALHQELYDFSAVKISSVSVDDLAGLLLLQRRKGFLWSTEEYDIVSKDLKSQDPMIIRLGNGLYAAQGILIGHSIYKPFPPDNIHFASVPPAYFLHVYNSNHLCIPILKSNFS